MPKAAKRLVLSDRTLIIVTFVALLTISFNVTLFIHERLVTKVLGAQSLVIEEVPALKEEKLYWEKVVREHSTYRDAYIELADIENKLGNTKEAKELLKIARGIDPHF